MALKINKSGFTSNGAPYNALYVELNTFIESHYDRVSVNVKCYDFDDVSILADSASPIIPENWDRFNPMQFQFEAAAEIDLENWVNEKCIRELSTPKKIPYEYMAYEDNVYELDPSTGEIALDPSSGLAIIIHKKGELIRKRNGTYMFYTKILPRFCEDEYIEII